MNSNHTPDRLPTIILISRDPADTVTLGAMLSRSYEMLVYEEPEEAVQAVLEKKVDLVIADIESERPNGYEFTCRLRTYPDQQSVPIILLSANRDPDIMIKAFECGADDFLFKPFEVSEFLIRIRAWMRSRLFDQKMDEKNRVIAERNEIIESELDIARAIHSKLTPLHEPVIPGISLAAFILPFDKVGGDYYELKSADGILHIFFADAAGHGIPAAFLASITKMAVHYNMEKAGSCSELIEILDETVDSFSPEELYVTCVYARYDFSSRILSYSAAGHRASLLLRPGENKIRELDIMGIPLGLLYEDGARGKESASELQIQLEEGDRLVFYTDGVTDTLNAEDITNGIDILYDFLIEHRDLDAQSLRDEMRSLIESGDANSPREDDASFLVIDILRE